jgi:hypothetical protein
VVGPDRAPHAVRPLHRKDMAVVGDAAVAVGDLGRGRSDGERRNRKS